ncbi:G-type lectin S-receptor-like serine/threonine-protein kinase B120 isoform X1 [Aegilops tauschii subsp. strangulata]|nr:G-type lectin S-receptor-like serine/threonine-protein kinase B120 isoform X1 [Aegilops tauschii subsp. strangulata]XP_044421671.1 G-type lectin S-receptor-like serine/threonine-protein kinase B120 isoform X1 [Triticum aestivum]
MDPTIPIHTVICLVCWSFSLLPLCASSSRHLLPGKPLSAGSTITSNDGTFALGFFSPSSSGTKQYYIGIWYKNIPEDNVVWVANRAMPVTDPSSATLAFTNGSDLALSDTNGQLLWTTNISAAGNSSSEATAGKATLYNNGNFILRSQGIILWQSFDYPTDTLLPGMNFRITHKTHALQQLISWRNPQDPSPGNFTYGAHPDEFLQRFVWNGSTPYRRSPVWNNFLVVGQYIGSIKSTIYFTLQTVDDEVYISFGVPAPSVSSLVLVKMDCSGKMKIRTWNSNVSKWTDLQSEPNQECNKYGYCGPFGYCDNTQPIVTCKCLDGFEPNNKQDWTARRFSQGCHRMEALRCGQGDGFLNMSSMKVPDQFVHVKNRSLDDCIADCTSNCSCTAYAYANMSTKVINGDETRCLLWIGDLIDTEKLMGEGENLYIRVNGFSDKKRKSIVLKITLPVVSSLLIVICVWLVWICNLGGKQKNKKNLKKVMSGTSSTSVELHDGNLKYPFISFKEIVLATNNFSNSNMLGHGGFGNVYKGTLEDGTKIAVKRLSKGSGQGVMEFRNEVILIAKLQHQNLVRLLGFCIHGDEKLLIYEYLPNKSLDAMLFDATRKSMLDWPMRFEIIKGVARGLLYLHQDSRLKIIHRDLKASNILLDAEMSPKISDFGMARIFGGNQQQENTNRVVGTYGYMSPEYVLKGVFSVKSDVYSFGVLLLEIVSGSKISSVHLKADFSSIIAYAWSLWKDGNTQDFVDSSIVGSCSLNETSRCIHIGLLCVQGRPNARPLVSSIVSFLENGDISLPTPKEPMYFAEDNYGTDGAAENTAKSANNMSITVLEGR